MTTSTATEAIAALIELAQQGEIDPWDVQVIDVIDRFLVELGIPHNSPHNLDFAYQQANLPKSGQVFLWASMLVRFKADTLDPLENPEPEELPLPLEEIPTNERSRLTLEQHLRRRTAAPPTRKRRVTLQELIGHIEQIAGEIDKATPTHAKRRNPRPQSRREAIEIVTQLAHQENLTELAAQLEDFLTHQLTQFTQSTDWIDLEQLLTWWQQIHPNNTTDIHQGRDRVGIFWALLLLSSQSKVELSQKEFYQDLQIQVLT